MAGKPKNDAVTLRRRIEEKTMPVPWSGCLLWLGAACSKGYGKIGIRDDAGIPRTVPAHRMVYALEYGPIPEGMVVMHKCDVPSCIAIEHLMLGTQAENLADMWAKGRAKPGLIPSDARSNSKLTWEAVRLIRASQESAKSLARKLGVSDILVGRVRNGFGWKEIVT